MNEDTPFMLFWKAINRHLGKCGLPELLFADAREAWEAAVSRAGSLSRQSVIDKRPDVGAMAKAATR